MSILSYLKNFFMYPEIRFGYLSKVGFYNMMKDQKYISKCYRIKIGQKLNLDNPVTFNEKLQWLKLYDRKPEYSSMVDKFEAKKYVAERIGEECIIPTLGVWDKFDDIDFSVLPEKFVLKCTHDSGGLVICQDKEQFDTQKAKVILQKSLKRNFYLTGREWPYKNVKPRIIAEQYLEGMDELVEYKMFCFNGEVKMILVCKGQAHGEGRTNDFCDCNLNKFPFTSLNPQSKDQLEVPRELPELIEFAERLSAGIPQLRVDTYLMDGKIYFGELTFFHNSGFCKFEPAEWDEILGSWIQLPQRGNMKDHK